MGLFQMEPATFAFVMEYLERTGKFPEIKRNTPIERLVTDIEFATAMARVYLWTHPEAIPDADDLDGLARYAKKYWNTDLGAATADKYKSDFLTHVWGNNYEIS